LKVTIMIQRKMPVLQAFFFVTNPVCKFSEPRESFLTGENLHVGLTKKFAMANFLVM
jgi:hypothetical protein